MSANTRAGDVRGVARARYPAPRPSAERVPCYDDTTIHRPKQIGGFKDDLCKDWTL